MHAPVLDVCENRSIYFWRGLRVMVSGVRNMAMANIIRKHGMMVPAEAARLPFSERSLSPTTTGCRAVQCRKGAHTPWHWHWSLAPVYPQVSRFCWRGQDLSLHCPAKAVFSAAQALCALQESARARPVPNVFPGWCALWRHCCLRESCVPGSMLYDRQQMQPLFRLAVGNPGSSFALEIARKTGIPQDIIRQQSALYHVLDNTYGLKRNRLAACVRAALWWRPTTAFASLLPRNAARL